MTNWASLAGFKGFRSDEDLVTYTAESFSLKAAFNSQLIPPRWNDYLMEEQNKFVTSVQDEYDRNHQTKIRAVQFVVLLRENGQLKMTIFISLRRAMMFLTVL